MTRQLKNGSSVPQPPVNKARVAAERIRAAMLGKGWVTSDGLLDIRRLADATKTRWQTVQFWTGGSHPHRIDEERLNKEPPRSGSLDAIAKALDMTPAELLGLAAGEDPRFSSWHTFLREQADRGDPVTDVERAALAALQWPHGPPDVAAYRMILGSFRNVPGYRKP